MATIVPMSNNVLNAAFMIIQTDLLLFCLPKKITTQVMSEYSSSHHNPQGQPTNEASIMQARIRYLKSDHFHFSLLRTIFFKHLRSKDGAKNDHNSISSINSMSYVFWV